ncbi:MAG TPA: hypothetical protein VHM70_05165 [Polyangiaceae bacterium]|nr:hypothetical protein [Polyangiaceae bacterium]
MQNRALLKVVAFSCLFEVFACGASKTDVDTSVIDSGTGTGAESADDTQPSRTDGPTAPGDAEPSTGPGSGPSSHGGDPTDASASPGHTSGEGPNTAPDAPNPESTSGDSETSDSDNSTDDLDGGDAPVADTGASSTGSLGDGDPTGTGSSASDAGSPEPVTLNLPAPGTPIQLPDGCTSDYAASSDTYCGQGFTCNGDTLSTSCNLYDDGWRCECSSLTYGRFEFGLNGVTDEQRCDYAVNLCLSTHELTPSGPVSCEIQRPPPSEQCVEHYRCFQAQELGNGVQALVPTEGRDLSCSATDRDGTWSCQCSAEVRFAALEMSNTDLAGACRAYETACLETSELVFSGQPDCVDETNDTADFSCNLIQTCRADAELDSGAIATAVYEQYGQCDDNPGGLDCYCGKGDFSRSFRMSGETLDCAAAELPCTAGPIEFSPYECDYTDGEQSAPDGCSSTFACHHDGSVEQVSFSETALGSVSCAASGTGWDCACYSDAVSGDPELTVQAASPSEACKTAATLCTARIE